MPRHVFLALTLFGLFPTFVFAQAVLPATFQPDYEKLAALMNQEEVGALDVAQGSLIASRFFVAGPVGLLPMQDSFNRAQTVGEGSVSGLYVVLYGKQKEIEGVRYALETQRAKRIWLYNVVGTEENYQYALQDSSRWKPLMRLLPSTVGCRQLVTQCMQSRDPLVRRAGLYWGYWMPDSTYWTDVRHVVGGDPDPLTRKMAAHLLLLAM